MSFNYHAMSTLSVQPVKSSYLVSTYIVSVLHKCWVICICLAGIMSFATSMSCDDICLWLRQNDATDDDVQVLKSTPAFLM